MANPLFATTGDVEVLGRLFMPGRPANVAEFLENSTRRSGRCRR